MWLAVLLTVAAVLSPVLQCMGYEECTLRQGTPLIVGGYPLNCTVPWMVSFRNEKDEHVCAGSLIAENVVLTAAHCIGHGRLPVSADIGRVQLDGPDDDSGFTKLLVSRAISHEQYDPATYDFDVALVVLGSSTERTLSQLAHSDACFHAERGCEVRLIGWGYTTEGGLLADQVRMAEARSVTKAECRKRYGKVKANITNNMICAGDIYEGGRDACVGDSGGPILVKGEQVGLVSWGIGCGLPEYPGVYASVPTLRPWIMQNLESIRESA